MTNKRSIKNTKLWGGEEEIKKKNIGERFWRELGRG